MATYTKFNDFVAALAHKLHDLESDQLTVALTTLANAPVAGDSVLTDLTEISYTNLSSLDITTISSAQTGGTYKLTLTDLVLTASGAVATFRYVAIYNDTATLKNLICFFDYGQDVTLANGETFTLDFDGAEGLFQLV